MEWFALTVTFTRQPEWLRLPHRLRADYVQVMALAAERETGGVIVAARDWTDRDWDRACGVSRGAVGALEKVGLVAWREADLVVVGYEIDREERVKRSRQQAQSAARIRWQGTARPAKSLDSADADASSTSTAASTAAAYAEERGEERIRAEQRGEERREERRARSAASPIGETAPSSGKPHRVARKVAKPETPLPYTVAALLETVQRESGGRIETRNFSADADRWAPALTRVIRKDLAPLGYGLREVALGARFVARTFRKPRDLGWLATRGQFSSSIQSAIEAAAGRGARNGARAGPDDLMSERDLYELSLELQAKEREP